MMNEFIDRSKEGHLAGQDISVVAETRFRAFLDASTDIIYLVSPSWEELRHVDGRGMIADTLRPRRDWIDDYVFADDRHLVLAEIRRAIETKSMFELQHRVLKEDGTVGWTLSRAVPLSDEAGEISEWFGAATDVTERYSMAEEVARLTAASDQQRRLYESLISAKPTIWGNTNHIQWERFSPCRISANARL